MFSVEEQIEYLCSCEFSDYRSLKSQIRLEGAITPSRQSTLRSLAEISAEQDERARRKKRLQEFEDYKKGLRVKTPAEIQALVEQRKAEAANRERQELLARIEAERQKFRPDWSFWPYMSPVQLWQACALSLDIDPDKMKAEPNSWKAGPGSDHAPLFTLTSFPSNAVADGFNKRLRLAMANFGGDGRQAISLSDFAEWALSIPLFQYVPAEFVALIKHEVTDAVNVERGLSIPPETQEIADHGQLTATGADTAIDTAVNPNMARSQPVNRHGNNHTNPSELQSTKHWVSEDDIVNAFPCLASRRDLFRDGHVFDWFARGKIKGKSGRGGYPPRYDPWAFTEGLPGTSYGGSLTSKQAWGILERFFPDRYEEVMALDPRK
jgi:hypothetical protein